MTTPSPAPPAPPPSPTAPQPPRTYPRGCLPTFAVALVMVGIIAGGAVAASAVADLPNQPITIAEGVVITPPQQWEFGGRSEDRNTILISDGRASVAITVDDGTDEVAALNELRTEWDAFDTVTAGEVAPVEGLRSQPTSRFSYSGVFPDFPSAVEGEATGVRGSQVVVLFDAWAGFGEFVRSKAAVDLIIQSATIP